MPKHLARCELCGATFATTKGRFCSPRCQKRSVRQRALTSEPVPSLADAIEAVENTIWLLENVDLPVLDARCPDDSDDREFSEVVGAIYDYPATLKAALHYLRELS